MIAAGLNYKSHIGQASPAKYVGLFAKFPTSLIGHDGDIIYPADATNVHYEAEICIVMGKKAQNITEAQVKDHIFGVTRVQRRQRARLAEAGPAVVPRQGGRHVRSDGPARS